MHGCDHLALFDFWEFFCVRAFVIVSLDIRRWLGAATRVARSARPAAYPRSRSFNIPNEIFNTFAFRYVSEVQYFMHLQTQHVNKTSFKAEQITLAQIRGATIKYRRNICAISLRLSLKLFQLFVW